MTGGPDTGLAADVAATPVWYHTIELAPGLVTPGWFDLRPIVERLPWPEVAGRRCLDVGTYDGFLAFELERRGAGEVVATDIPSEDHWDWPVAERSWGPAVARGIVGEEKGRGFQVAHRALRSAVERVEVSVYELDPERIGSFDVVVCGSLLLHLRDPVGALERIRAVCSGCVLSVEEINPWLTLAHPRRAVARLRPMTMQWWVPNLAGHREMLGAAGFAIEAATRLATPFGVGHPRLGWSPRSVGFRAATRLVGGRVGVPCSALRARPQRLD
jgi:tRNA (mo5U34)-methyltransferase